jgi:hypothetical protein
MPLNHDTRYKNKFVHKGPGEEIEDVRPIYVSWIAKGAEPEVSNQYFKEKDLMYPKNLGGHLVAMTSCVGALVVPVA